MPYAERAPDVKTKEMPGLVASMILRCEDCINYPLQKCRNQVLFTKEIYEVFAVANIVGDKNVISHTLPA